MSSIMLKCLDGHTTVWDPNTEDFPTDGCDTIVGMTDEGHNKYCDKRYGNVALEDPEGWPNPVENDISNIVRPDAPITTNEDGGSQSYIPVRFDLIDGKAMFAMAAVLHEGAKKYSPGNWRLISERDHLNHALMHIFAYLSGDRTDEHLSHALCRVTFANAVAIDPDAGPERDE